MKKAYMSILMVILFSIVVVSFSYAQGGCCSSRIGMLRYVQCRWSPATAGRSIRRPFSGQGCNDENACTSN